MFMRMKSMTKSNGTSQHVVSNPQRTVAEEGDVNVLPYPPGCRATTQSKSRQLLPTPQVAPLAR
jgi:hypothetical protein